MRKSILLFILTLFFFMFHYSCVSNAEGNVIKKDIAKMNAKYKMLENRVNEEQNKVSRKLKRVDVKLLELDKILKEAKALLYRNNADFGQDVEMMDIRVKKVEGSNEEVLFKFEQLNKKFNELKQSIGDLNGNLAIATAKTENTNETSNQKASKKEKQNKKEEKKHTNTQQATQGTQDYKDIKNPISLFSLGYGYISGKKHKGMPYKERMQKAIEVFNHLIEKYPNHKKSNSGRYWITQAYYASAQYEKAYRSMNDFLKKYPNSRHIPQILFQMGNSLVKLGLKKDGKTIFKTLVKAYPKSGYSKKAKTLLKKL